MISEKLNITLQFTGSKLSVQCVANVFLKMILNNGKTGDYTQIYGNKVKKIVNSLNNERYTPNLQKWQKINIFRE